MDLVTIDKKPRPLKRVSKCLLLSSKNNYSFIFQPVTNLCYVNMCMIVRFL